MRKIQFFAVSWTLILAVPITAIVLSGLAWTTEHLLQISQTLAEFSRATTAGGRGLILEMSERWPEIAGMVVGQIVIMMVLLFVHKTENGEEKITH